MGKPTKSAIEGFVRSLLTEHGLIKDPYSFVNSRKKQMHGFVKGTVPGKHH